MKTILVVDDDEWMRSALRVMLTKNGFAVLEASTGEEARQCYATDRPDLVLMDIILPGEHGLSAMAKLFECDPDARIIAFSGLRQPTLVEDALKAGARDFLLKPFELADILAAIHRHIK